MGRLRLGHGRLELLYWNPWARSGGGTSPPFLSSLSSLDFPQACGSGKLYVSDHSTSRSTHSSPSPPCSPVTSVSLPTRLNGALDGCAGAHLVPLVLLGHMAEYILPDGVLLLQAHIKAEIFLALGPTLGLQAT